MFLYIFFCMHTSEKCSDLKLGIMTITDTGVDRV